MGTFRITVEVENPLRAGERRAVQSVLVDTGSELSWFPAPVLESLGVARYERKLFRQASGTIIERWVGPAFVHAAGKRASDDVVFGEPGDLTLLGARSLEGLNLRVDTAAKTLVDAGPTLAATAGASSGMSSLDGQRGPQGGGGEGTTRERSNWRRTRRSVPSRRRA